MVLSNADRALTHVQNLSSVRRENASQNVLEGALAVEDSSAISTIEAIHDRALREAASDIHVEPTDRGGRVRQRVDGILIETRTLPSALFNQVISRLKLLAGMDIADKRQPQDGRYHIERLDMLVDARVSSVPTIRGEKIVVRLLDTQARIPDLRRLGMSPEVLGRYRRLIHAPHGFIVACGPTGSGKTTTLYGSLNERNDASQHLCTVEDPVEIRLSGVAQVQVNVKAGVTFALALRSFLRQDPNVIMIGEMRDAETTAVAISAALSGQLVMTTLHASDAIRTVERLLELQARPHAIAASLSGIIAQRLVRQLCSQCRQRVEIADDDARELRIPQRAFVYRPLGCAQCGGTGFRGRIGLFELLTLDDALRAAIGSGATAVELKQLTTEQTFAPMELDARTRILSGETSIEEVRRVFCLPALV